MKQKPFYELMLDIAKKHDEILSKQAEQYEINAQILLNQDEIIVNQEYGNCLLELNQTV